MTSPINRYLYIYLYLCIYSSCVCFSGVFDLAFTDMGTCDFSIGLQRFSGSKFLIVNLWATCGSSIISSSSVNTLGKAKLAITDNSNTNGNPMAAMVFVMASSAVNPVRLKPKNMTKDFLETLFNGESWSFNVGSVNSHTILHIMILPIRPWIPIIKNKPDSTA